MPTVSVITPWIDHPELIPDYEQAVRGAQVITIDNGSGPQAADQIRAMTERLQGIYLRNEVNAGFAGGNNQGLAHATGDVVLFLNNDIAADPGFLDAVVHDTSEGELVGPALSRQCVYSLPLHYLEGWCIAGRRSAWQKVGGWDAEAYRQPYWEDCDLCLRARQAGFSLKRANWPVRHKGGQTAGLSVFWGEIWERNRAVFAARVLPLYRQVVEQARKMGHVPRFQ
jgi:GT2 family glycosyltransferase